MDRMGDVMNQLAAMQSAGVVRPGPINMNTQLSPQDEAAFLQWVQENNVPFDPNAGITDYDMRGFWQGLQSGDPHAHTGVDPYDKQLHFSDYYKNPTHETYSNEARSAGPNAPHWGIVDGVDVLVAPDGRIVFQPRMTR